MSEEQTTPRLDNPVSMLRRKRSSLTSDNIPNERPEPIRLVPFLMIHNQVRMKCKRNLSQFIGNNRSGFTYMSPSLGSHE